MAVQPPWGAVGLATARKKEKQRERERERERFDFVRMNYVYIDCSVPFSVASQNSEMMLELVM